MLMQSNVSEILDMAFSWSCIQGNSNSLQDHLSASLTFATCWTISAGTFPSKIPTELRNTPDGEIFRQKGEPEGWLTLSQQPEKHALQVLSYHKAIGAVVSCSFHAGWVCKPPQPTMSLLSE